jgi:predicted membrane-bound dolichyl-phosphate-mannose-protein mannosyltransferase
MFSNPNEFIKVMATILFLIGLITLGLGIFTLARQAIGKVIQTIAEQTTKLAQKGISEDIAGLVGNASSLIAALDQLVRSTAGIGIILILVSFALLGSSYALISQIR